MPAEVETMLFAKSGGTPWHGLGVPVEGALTCDEAIRTAGLDWQVGTKPLLTADGESVPALATYRQSDGSILGVVGPDYRALQNSEAFSWFEPFVASGEATFETAGSLRGGRRVWILAKINRAPSVIVPKADDRVEKYLLMSNSHDGSLAVRVGFSPTRVVCSNTLALAHRHDASQFLRVRHRGNVAQNLEAIRETINLADAKFEATAEQYRRLAAKEIDSEDLRRYVDVVFSAPSVSDEKPTEHERLHAKIVPLFEHGRGNDLPGVKGTAWAAYNAVNEFLGYERGRSQDTRLDSLWFGASANTNRRALDAALAMAA